MVDMGKYDVQSASGPRPAKKTSTGKVDNVSIEPSDNGGFTVTCRREAPKPKKGEYSGYVEPDKYVFGSAADMLAHVGGLFGNTKNAK